MHDLYQVDISARPIYMIQRTYIRISAIITVYLLYLAAKMAKHYDLSVEHFKRVAEENHIWNIFTTRMKIHKLILNFMLRGSRSRTRYSMIMSRITMIQRKYIN